MTEVRNERSWILVGFQLSFQTFIGIMRRKTERTRNQEDGTWTKGSPVAVVPDGLWAMNRHLNEDDVMGFIHTHPSLNLNPSETDLDAMETWYRALGKKLYHLIADSELGTIRAYGYSNPVQGPYEVKVSRFFNVVFITDLTLEIKRQDEEE